MIKNKNRSIFIIIFISGLIALNLFFSIHFFGTNDVRAWIRSAGLTNEYGIVKGYYIYTMNYPPLSSVMLWVTGKIAGIKPSREWLNEYPTFIEAQNTYTPIKISIFIMYNLLALVVFYYLLKKKNYSFSKSILRTSWLYLNPAFIFVNSIFGYMDIYFVPFLLGSFMLLESNLFFLSGAFFAISFLIKLLPIFLLPVFIAYFVSIKFNKFKIKILDDELSSFILGIVVVLIPTLGVFGFQSMESVFDASAVHGGILSNGATNLNYLLSTYFYPNNITPLLWLKWSKYLFYILSAFYILTISLKKKSIENIYLASIGIFLSYYILFTGVHENHLFPALIPALGLILNRFSKGNILIFINISLIVFLNVFSSYGFGNILQNGIITQVFPPFFNQIKNLWRPMISFYSTLYLIYYTYSFYKKTR